jgi:hypothetical protein
MSINLSGTGNGNNSPQADFVYNPPAIHTEGEFTHVTEELPINYLFEVLGVARDLKRIASRDVDGMDADVADTIWRKLDTLQLTVERFIEEAGSLTDK